MITIMKVIYQWSCNQTKCYAQSIRYQAEVVKF